MKEIDLKQIKSMKELKKELGDKYDEIMYQMNLELLNRMEKAIEYIEEQTVDVEMNIYGMPPTIKSFRGNTERLLEILKGSDKE